ncbi:hypothetical protein VA7868_03839 [Vibrio aerogenes CECT 7868]|uniref:Uncharacterized protein n=1 Tax=Vibrio aerogenes CECT 7868 TaxID=1216006 RepID=A0A1M6BPT0_9VIBR|nr:hypothetical protein VA7868_03839 [Vibrio aerogenes CECT 7868]
MPEGLIFGAWLLLRELPQPKVLSEHRYSWLQVMCSATRNVMKVHSE